MDVLFIAHNGVTQPNVWNLWKRYMKHDINFHVICPNHPQYGKNFCMKHQISVMGKTSWGGFSIVYETIRALCKINLQKTKRVFIVSGYDIPILNLNTINYGDSEIIGKIDSTEGSLFSHSQWICLTRECVQHIVLVFKDNDKAMLKLFYDCICLVEKNPQLAPDEVWLNFIGYNKKKFSKRFMTLPFFHDSTHRISPIQWNHITLKEYIHTGMNKGYRINMLQAIYLSRQSEYLFFRKVSPTIKLNRNFLLSLYISSYSPNIYIQNVDESNKPSPKRPNYIKKQRDHKIKIQNFLKLFGSDIKQRHQFILALAKKCNFDQTAMIQQFLS